MAVYSRWRGWPSSLRPRDARDADLDRELTDWVAELAERYEAAGVSAAEARRRALIETGGVEQAEEAVRGVRIGAGLEACLRAVRYARPGLWKSPVFAAAGLPRPAVGHGGAAAGFSVGQSMRLGP